MKYIALIVVCSFTQFKASLPGATADCFASMQKQDFDPDKMPGTWFETLVERAESEYELCTSAYNISKSPDGFYFNLRSYHLKNDTHGDVAESEQRSAEQNVYEWHGHSGKLAKEFASDNPGLLNRLGTWLNNFRTRRLVYFTDYSTYLAELSCDGKGVKHIAVFTRRQHPTAHDVIRVTNRLKDIGKDWTNMKLFLSACATTNKNLSVERCGDE